MNEGIFLLVCGLVLASKAQGATLMFTPDLCLKGPQFWCSSHETAQKCAKTEYCQMQWAKDSNVMAKTDGCVGLVKILQSALKDDLTEENFVQGLERICYVLPGSSKALCDDLVKHSKQEMLQLSKSFSPEEVCKILELPTQTLPAQFDRVDNFVTEKTKGRDLCLICNIIRSALGDMLELHRNEHEIEKALDKVCDTLPDVLKPPCNVVIKKYEPMIVTYLVNHPLKDLCPDLELCSHRQHLESGQWSDDTQTMDSSVSCISCQVTSTILGSLLKENRTQADIEASLDGVCDLLTGVVKDHCDSLVKLYRPKIVTFLLEHPVKDMCQFLNLCPAPETVNPKHSNGVEKRSSQDGCVACESISTTLENLLEEKRTRKDINTALDMVCHMLPISFGHHCEDLVNQYRSSMVPILLSHPVTEMCSLLNLCPVSHKAILKHSNDFRKRSVPDDNCVICETITTLVETLLKKHKTPRNVNHALNVACNLLPELVRKPYVDLVMKYRVFMIVYLLGHPAKHMCSHLYLCPRFHKVQTNSFVAEKSQDFGECIVCDMVSSLLGTQLKGKSKHEVQEELDKVCGLLPGILKESCVGLVKKYEEKIVEAVQKHPVKGLCHVLGICTSFPREKSDQYSDDHKTVDSEGPCIACQVISTVLGSLLKENRTQTDIEAALDGVCDLLPGVVKDHCDSLVKLYRPKIVTFLLDHPVKDMCQFLNLCPGFHKVQSAGYKKKEKITPTCLLCDLISILLRNLLKTNSTQRDIESALDHVCYGLPGELKHGCEWMIHRSRPQMMRLIRTHPLKEMCWYLGICPSVYKDPSQVSLPDSDKPTAAHGHDSEASCFVCKLITAVLQTTLKANRSQHDIKIALDTVCYVFPDGYRDVCKGIMNLYEQQMLHLLIKHPLKDMCHFIGLCPMHNEPVPEPEIDLKPSDVLCNMCDCLMEPVVHFWESNKTVEAVKSALERLCHQMPFFLKPKCLSYVKNYTQINETSGDICRSIGVCSHHSKRRSSQIDVYAAEKSYPCHVCDCLMEPVVAYWDNNAVPEVKSLLEKVCDRMPFLLKDECVFMVDYFPILDTTPGEVCSHLRICPNKTTVPTTPPPSDVVQNSGVGSGKDETLCYLCDVLIKKVSEALRRKTSVTEIEGLLDNLCALLPERKKYKCLAQVKKYTPQIFNLTMSPKRLCHSLDICQETAPILGFGQSELIAMSSSTSNVILCDICRFVVAGMDKVIKNDGTVHIVETLLYRHCEHLEANAKIHCYMFLRKFIPFVKNLPVVPPKVVCERISLCSNETVIGHQEFAGVYSGSTSIFSLCESCEFLVNKMDIWLSKNGTLEYIQGVLDTFCTRVMNRSYRCRAIMDSFYMPWLKHLSSIPPKVLCQKSHLCRGNSSFIMPMELERIDFSQIECDLCQMVMKVVDKVLKENGTISHIKSVLDKICDQMVADQKEYCLAVVETYLPYLQDMPEIPPLAICQKGKFCAKNATFYGVQVSDENTCQMCDQIARHMMTNDGTSQDDIEKLLQVCTRLASKSNRYRCESLLRDHFVVIEEVLKTGLNPYRVCKLLGPCT